MPEYDWDNLDEDDWEAHGYHQSFISRFTGNRTLMIGMVALLFASAGLLSYVGVKSTRTSKKSPTANSSAPVAKSPDEEASQFGKLQSQNTTVPTTAATTSTTTDTGTNDAATVAKASDTKSPITAPSKKTGTSTPDRTPSAGASMTKVKYIAAADAVCDKYHTTIQKAYNESDFTALAATSTTQINELWTIKAPTADAEKLGLWLGTMENAVASLKQNDTASAITLSNDGFSQAGDYGMKSCSHI